jgi:hypothetical protein
MSVVREVKVLLHTNQGFDENIISNLENYGDTYQQLLVKSTKIKYPQ